MNPDIIHDRYGRPLVRLFTDGRFVSFRGDHVGYVAEGGAVYSYLGKHLGWFENGILRDLKGNCVAYGMSPADSPIPLLPLRNMAPMAQMTKMAPMSRMRQMPHMRPMKRFSWSPIELSQFFFQ